MEKNLQARFTAARKLFPVADSEKKIVYFNSASTGPLSRPLKEKLDWYYDLAQYQTTNTDFPAFAALDKIRALGAGLIHARRDEVGFGFHTGYGLNIAAFGLPLKKGDEILLSEVEFPSNVYPWVALKERGIKVKFLKSRNRCFDIDIFLKAISRKTRVLSLSFVQFFNGYKNNLAEIGKICREHGLYFVVDGIQGCGAEVIDVKKCQVDIFSAGAQKWMLSPLGTGLFYIRKDLQPKLLLPWASWLSVDWKLKFSDLFYFDKPFFPSARRFELGTYPYAHVFAMAEALTLIDSLGVKNIQDHNHGLIDNLVTFLSDHKRYRLVSSLEPQHRSSIFSFTCDRAPELYRRLLKNKIICSYREGAIRISVHLFNNQSDIDRLITILKK